MTRNIKTQITLPYGGTKGSKLMTKMKKQLKKLLLNKIKRIVTYQSKQLSTKFHVNNEINFCHKKKTKVFHGKCPQ